MEKSPDSDSKDIAGALSGDSESYQRLIRRYQQEIGQQMLRFTRDSSVREELVHDTFVEAYLSLRHYRGTAPWLHWLRKIAVHVGYRYWKNRGACREVTLSKEDWDHVHTSLAHPGDATDSTEVVYTLLSLLAPSDRLILTLIYVDGYSMAEAAQAAGWTLIGTKVRAFRARQRLRQLLDGGTHGN